MTPKFDNLASLLMEMPTPPIPDEKKLDIATYIEEFPKDSYREIADAFGVSLPTVWRIAKELEIGRGVGRAGIDNVVGAWARMHKGKETHPERKLSDDQEKQILYYWKANHDDMTYTELARWVRQQFNVVMSNKSLPPLLKRAAAKQKPPVQLPPSDPGKGMRLRKQRVQHRNEPGTGKLPTQSSHHFKDTEPGIVPSNPKHGGPAHPPK